MKVLVFTITLVLFSVGCKKSLWFDVEGTPHGSGERSHFYKSGATQVREEYIDGQVVRSRWFTPDGKLIEQTNWKDGAGDGIYLREDGSIRCRMHYLHGLAEGQATYYDEAGAVIRVEQFHSGKPVHEVSK